MLAADYYEPNFRPEAQREGLHSHSCYTPKGQFTIHSSRFSLGEGKAEQKEGTKPAWW